jgi:mitochondrial fission protein ELM1
LRKRRWLVHLFHVQAPLHHFDLVITLPQYRLPRRPNVLHLTGALNRIPAEQLAAAAERWRPALAALPRPWIGLIVGGHSSSYELDAKTAARLAREASAEARAAGGSLLVSTTPRTSADAAEALFAAIDAPAWRYRWQPDDPHNPYLGYLALADRFIVTVDSASLPMEACATGKPVQVFEWPRRRSAAARLRELLARGPGARLYDALVAVGLVKPPRDFDAYHRELRRLGLASRLGETPPAAPGQAPDDLARAVERIQQLVAGPRAPAT